MTIRNEGINTGPTPNFVGYVADTQLYMPNPLTTFNARFNANISVTNTQTEMGDLVGYVGSQISFAKDFIAQDNLVLSATNHGTVAQNQILFEKGLSVGRYTSLSAINAQLVSNGIVFSGQNATTGGDIVINLTDTSLKVLTQSGASLFTIAGLNGNAGLFVISN